MTIAQLPSPTPAFRDRDQPLFDRVVLGIDFESPSLAAARWATAHVARGAHAILTHAVALPEHSAAHDAEPGDGPTGALHHVTPTLHGGLAGVAGTLGIASHRVAVRPGRASRWLSEVANEAEASLVVLGRRKDANRKRLGEPNVIERVVRRTNASALVVPEGATAPPEHVVAAVDESRHSAAVVRAALRIARRLARPLTILHILSPVAGAYDRIVGRTRARALPDADRDGVVPLSVPSRLPTRTARWLVELMDVRRGGAAATVEVSIGDPAREITRRALADDGAMIVVGQRGADVAPVGSLGSVARELLTRAPVPVLAVAVG